MAYKEKSPIPVVEGGTGAQTLTSNGVILGNGTSALAATAAGTTGQVLTGVTGSAPTFQSPAASSISITGNSGGALTGNAFTFTGGTTGLTFAGTASPNTETLGGTLAIANGGTDATSFSTSDGIVKYDGTRLVTSTTAKIDSSNRMTNTSQPSFLAITTSAQSNITGDGTIATLNFTTVIFDNNSNYDGTSTFTAPVTGKYKFIITVNMSGLTASHTLGNFEVRIAGTTNHRFVFGTGNFGAMRELSFNTLTVSASCISDMTAGDTALTVLTVSNGSKVVSNAAGTSGVIQSSFEGYLIC